MPAIQPGPHSQPCQPAFNQTLTTYQAHHSANPAHFTQLTMPAKLSCTPFNRLFSQTCHSALAQPDNRAHNAAMPSQPCPTLGPAQRTIHALQACHLYIQALQPNKPTSIGLNFIVAYIYIYMCVYAFLDIWNTNLAIVGTVKQYLRCSMQVPVP